MIVEPRVEDYAEAHTSPPGDLFERLAAETREKTEVPQMMVGPVEGRLLEWGCGHLDDALLVFSELVTNAVTHAGSAERVQVRGHRALAGA